MRGRMEIIMTTRRIIKNLTVSVLLAATMLSSTSCGLLISTIGSALNQRGGADTTPPPTTITTAPDQFPETPPALNAQEVYELISPSVVEVNANGPTISSTGTGFFYDNNGTIITNYHVIEDCTSATITLSNSAVYSVTKVLGYDKDRDIAILATTCSYSTPLTVRNSNVKTGETVYAIGSSLGLTGSLSDGIISTAQRNVDGYDFIQTTAPISHGNSGGPLIDENGLVIGITSASFSEGQNLNLAIPIADVTKIDLSSPTTLSEIFVGSATASGTVEWMRDWDAWHIDDSNQFVIVFELSDENNNVLSADGQIDIRIVNNAGVTVYAANRSFTKSNFEYWYDDDDTEYYLASIYINDYEISSGATDIGTVYITVSGSDYSFQECTIDVDSLPTSGGSDYSSVQYITSWDAWHDDDEQNFVVVFGLEDSAENEITASGQAQIVITNDSGTVVYNSNHTFTPSNFEYWYDDDYNEYNLCTFYIDDYSITAGSSEYGTVFITVSGSGFSFDECTVDVDSLPTSSYYAADVEYLADWNVLSDNAAQKYTIVFLLQDENESSLAASGTAMIRIVNDNGIEVFTKTIIFDESDFTYRSVNGNYDLYAGIDIYYSRIARGYSSSGTVYVEVTGDTFSFSEWSEPIYGLPLA